MGFQTPLSGELRMSAAAARALLALRPIDWYAADETLGAYLGGGAAYDEGAEVLRLDLGWVTWRLPKMMHLFAAMKDHHGTDRLVHHAPTYDAWYADGVFFLEPGRWAYVGAGPMFDVGRGSYDRPAHVGPRAPTLDDVRDWNETGPLATSVAPTDDGLALVVDTPRDGSFQVDVWMLGSQTIPITDDVLATARIADGGATVTFRVGDRELFMPVKDLHALRAAPA